jgi:hypothetical protein
MMRLLACLSVLLLAACVPPMREAVVEAPVVVEAEPAALGPGLDCRTGDDDGIGGTGCKTD